jgi:rfaE bifunctional protein kinase chain/domain
MNRQQLKKILDDIANVRIAVVGDFCMDAYWFIDETKSEISVETNQETRPVLQQSYSLGGAGNVTSNLAAMKIKDVRAFGVIGTDPFGAEMVRIMKETGIQTKNLLVQEKYWHTHTYAKPYINDKELNRIDFGNFNQLSEEISDKLIVNLINEIPDMDVILINQQVISGIHTDYFRKRLLEVIRKFSEKMFIVDSRNFNDYYVGTIHKMNDNEAARLCGMKKNTDDVVLHSEVVACAKMLYKRFGKPLFITSGSKGSLVIDQSGISDIPALMITSKVDTVGAGDSYLSGAAATLAAGYNMKFAATVATFVAGVTVQKLFQTGTATPKEIFTIGQDPYYVYSPELADNIRQAQYLRNTKIEIINKWEKNLCIRHVIFDHDGTISTLREGWEQIMAPMMIKAILGNNYEEADEALYKNVQIRVNEFIERTTGIQTLVQMKGLIELIREFDCVPEEKVLDEFGYKQIYNKALLKIVKVREKKLRKGELTLEDLTIKNAVPFLHKLHEAGIKLYLTSGTDEEDVIKEVRVLGYDHFFGKRIYGAIGDVNKEPKEMVLHRILKDIGESAFRSVATFGDGPVEMRETRKRGGLAIGVASNELKRSGLNEKKRSRLIKAGADIIIPDFSQFQHLLSLLNIQ